MKVLTGLSPFLRLLSVYNSENFRGNRCDVLWHSFHVLDVTASLILFAVFNMLVFWHLKDENYRISSPSIPTIIVGTQTLTSSISLIVRNQKMKAVIDHIKLIVTRSDENSIRAYEEIERKHELVTRVLFNISVVTCTVVFALTAMQPIAYIVFNSPKPEQWQLPISAHEPLSIDTYLGFYIGLVFQILSARQQIKSFTAPGSFHFGVCMYLNGMVENLYGQFADITDGLRNTRVDFTEIPSKLVRQFNFHNAILELAELAQQAMCVVLFYQLLFCAVITALSLFSLQTNDLLSYDTIVSIYELLWVLVMAFIYCYLSSQATTYLLKVNDSYYGCDWFMLPVKQQKLFILPMQRSQREFCFNGLGLVDCSLGTFAKIIKTAVSYFLIIRDHN